MTKTFDDDSILEIFDDPEPSDHPASIAERLFKEYEHQHIKENDITILWLMCNKPQFKGGRSIIAATHEPKVQGKLKDLFEQMLVKVYGFFPHYIITIDAGWWLGADVNKKEALIWHELCHIKQELDEFGTPKTNKKTGEPIFGLVGHDLEEFNSTVARYGAWLEDVQNFREALDGHGK